MENAKTVETGSAEDAALGELLTQLAARDYHFVTPTPRTHGRVAARPFDPERDALRNLLGWSRLAPRAKIDPGLLELLAAGGALVPSAPGTLASRYRVSSEGGRLYLHSAWPTIAVDSVFFGPDSYRFAAWLRRRLTDHAADVWRLAEIGAGTGIGALTTAGLFPGASALMTDINPAALRLARINALAAGMDVELHLTSGLNDVDGPFDLIVANPPYLIDSARRAYRDGGALWGAQSALDWAVQALARLRPGGALLLYSGAPVVGGQDMLRLHLSALADTSGAQMTYEEIDPDVWGEELEDPAYAQVERIAAIGATLTAPLAASLAAP